MATFTADPVTVQNMASQRYKDKVCVVTGGASGIGEGIVRVFVKHGSKVVICDKNKAKGENLASEVSKTGPGQAILINCDVTSEDDIKNLMEEVVSRFGGIDCLINNAGWHPPHQRIDEISVDDFRKLLDLNLVGYFLTCKHALPHLRKSKGNIINMSSLVAQIGQYAAVSYVASKGGVSAMTRALAIDEAKHSVRVNAVSPSNVWTALWEESMPDAEDRESVIKGGRDAQLLGRFGTPEEVGLQCLFLAAEGTFMTGVDLPFSGGAELDYGCKSKLGPTGGGLFN